MRDSDFGPATQELTMRRKRTMKMEIWNILRIAGKHTEVLSLKECV